MNSRSAARIGGAAAVAVALAVAVWIGAQRVEAAQSNVAMLGTGKDVSKVETSMVEYYNNTSGFLAKPAGDGKYPGIVMIHEWWG